VGRRRGPEVPLREVVGIGSYWLTHCVGRVGRVGLPEFYYAPETNKPSASLHLKQYVLCCLDLSVVQYVA